MFGSCLSDSWITNTYRVSRLFLHYANLAGISQYSFSGLRRILIPVISELNSVKKTGNFALLYNYCVITKHVLKV